VTICHKLDVVPELLANHAQKPDIYTNLLASSTSGSLNSRNSILMAYPRNLIAQTGGDDNYLQTIDIEPCQRMPVDYSGALMAALNRTASIG
jgi:hypothetical protein